MFFHPLNFEVTDGAKIAQDGAAGCISIGAGTWISPMEPLAFKVCMTPVKIEFRGPDRCFQLYNAKSKMRGRPPFTDSARYTFTFVEQE
jgi:hypothetical protein